MTHFNTLIHNLKRRIFYFSSKLTKNFGRPAQKFDDDWRGLFTKRVRANIEFGGKLWAALANVYWYHKDDPNKNECGASFRGAGDLINSMLGFNNYMDWLFDGFDAGVVSEEIASAILVNENFFLDRGRPRLRRRRFDR